MITWLRNNFVVRCEETIPIGPDTMKYGASTVHLAVRKGFITLSDPEVVGGKNYYWATLTEEGRKALDADPAGKLVNPA